MNKYHSPLITLLFWLAVFIFTIIFQIVLTSVLIIVSPTLFSKGVHALGDNGLYLSLSTLFQVPVIIALTIFFIKQKNGISIKEYLALNKTSLKKANLWLGLTLALVTIISIITLFIETYTPLIWFEKIWATANNHVFLLISILILAPLNEEIIYRGVLFTGLKNSRLGLLGATIITSFLWSFIHFQYDFINLTVIFLFGILLSMARHFTNSLYVTLTMHMFWNGFVVLFFLYAS